MRKLLTVFVAVLLVFSFVSFAAAQENDLRVEHQAGDMKWVPGGLPWKLFIPHYDIAGGWWSGLCIHNMSINANMYTIYFCNNNGNVMATAEGALTSYQKVAWMLDMAMTNCGTGWIVIESQFQLMSFINYGQTGAVTTLGPFWAF